jgi:polysaccharide export outer membrane protein
MKMDFSGLVAAFTLSAIVLVFALSGPAIGSAETPADQANSKKAAAIDPSYVIGPTDILEIQVWREPDFSRQVLVRPDGKLTLPLVGDIHVSGMNTMDLKELLTAKLKDYIDSPEVTVILVESHSKNFYIIGKVARPGTYALTPGMTVLQALSVAGGLGEWADKDSIRIIRSSDTKEKVIRFDYDKVMSGKNLGQNILLQPNDTIVVP